MTIDVTALRERLRLQADAAAALAKERAKQGFYGDAQFLSGRQAAFVAALTFLDDAEIEAATERDEALTGEGVDLAAVARLEAFSRGEDVRFETDRDGFIHSVGDVGLHRGYGDYATETGALDQASGTVYSDAEGGL